MRFAEAYQELKEGKKIKLPHWIGYWVVENGTVMMHCSNDKVIPLLESDDIFFTLDNIASDDWEVLSDSFDEKESKVNEDLRFSFSEALYRLKAGYRLSRKEWNNPKMIVVYQKGYPDGIKCNAQTATAWGMNEGDTFKCNPYFQIRNGNDTHSMYLPSVDDLLAKDWYVVTK